MRGAPRTAQGRTAFVAALALAFIGASTATAAALTPSDPAYQMQYGLGLVAAPAAWDLTTGSSSVLVASVDDGVDRSLQDLAVNLVPGYDFGNGDADPAQVESDHGTQTASFMAARGGNGIGMAGMTWEVSLMPLKVRTDGPGGRFEQIAPSSVAVAFRHAGTQGARIVNASFGLRSSTTTSERAAVLDEITRASSTLFVVSAGNNNQDNDATPRYPCNSDAPNLLCVAATDADDRLWDLSNYGARSVDLAAPGARVYVRTNLTNGPVDGTSYAAPLVSGAAALYFARYPNATVADVRKAILSSVDRLPTLENRTVSGGRLNVARALTVRPSSGAPGGTVFPPSTITLSPWGTPAHGLTAVSPATGALTGIGSEPVAETNAPVTDSRMRRPAGVRMRLVSPQPLGQTLRLGVLVSLFTRSTERVRFEVRPTSATAFDLSLRRLARSTTITARGGLRHVRARIDPRVQRRLSRQRRATLEVVAWVSSQAGLQSTSVRQIIEVVR